MEMRTMRILPVAAMAVLGLAAALGCGGKTSYNVPQVDSVSPSQAKVGDSVVLAGAYFKGIQTVSFGDARAIIFSVDSDTHITATVPNEAITGNVTVMNGKGVGTCYDAFTVVPTITGLALVSDSGTTPIIFRLTGSGFFGTTKVTVAGTDASFTINDQSTLTVNSTTTGTVVVTASGLTATWSETWSAGTPATPVASTASSAS